jgi:hypothetical protein
VNLGWLPVPRPGAAVEPLADLRRLMLGLFEDVSAMARATSSIPELGRQLAAIERHVESLDREVSEMRRGVEALQGDLVELSTSLAPVGALAGRLRGGRVRVRRSTRDGVVADESATIEP